MTEPLSPAAQVVLTAFGTHPIRADHIAEDLVPALAAALRAAAYQVAPESEVMPQQDRESRREAMIRGMVNQTQFIRQHLLAIAAELEGRHG